jgi:hypothetical protein
MLTRGWDDHAKTTLPVLALYERYRDGEVFLTGAFGGVRLFIHPIAGADPDDRSWRLYVAPRLQGIDKDPTTLTKPAPTGWAGLGCGSGRTCQQLAAIGLYTRFADQDERRGLDLFDDDDDR